MAQSIPTLTGYARTYANVGKTKNFGYDLTFNFVPVRTKDFEWNIGVNAAYSRNEIVSLANGKEDDPANGWFIGEVPTVSIHMNPQVYGKKKIVQYGKNSMPMDMTSNWYGTPCRPKWRLQNRRQQ